MNSGFVTSFKDLLLCYFSGLHFLLMTPIAQPDTNHSTKNDVDFRETLPLIWALSAFSVNTRLRPSPPPRPPPAETMQPETMQPEMTQPETKPPETTQAEMRPRETRPRDTRQRETRTAAPPKGHPRLQQRVEECGNLARAN